MTTRLLPRAEWGRLAGTLLEASAPYFSQETAIVVVEDGGAIVGCWALTPVYHAEGVWIAPAYRQKVSVGRRLLAGMRRLIRDRRVAEVLVMTTNPGTARMAQKLGDVTALGGAHFSIGVRT